MKLGVTKLKKVTQQKFEKNFNAGINGLQVNWGMWYRKFTKRLIFRDFDDVLKNPFGFVHLFLLLTLLSKNIFENRHA